MRPLLLVTRPADEAARTQHAAEEAGFDALVAPLMCIESLAWTYPAGDFDALLFTSPQGPNHAAAQFAQIAHLPVHAVGQATAKAAAACGFSVVAIGDRDASGILAQAAASGCRTMLHLSGEAVAAMVVPAGLSIARVPVYRAVLADALPEPAHLALAAQTAFATLLYSARTAQRFGTLVDSAGLDRSVLRIIAISQAAAAAVGPGWASVACASHPTTDALLAAAQGLWQRCHHG